MCWQANCKRFLFYTLFSNSTIYTLFLCLNHFKSISKPIYIPIFYLILWKFSRFLTYNSLKIEPKTSQRWSNMRAFARFLSILGQKCSFLLHKSGHFWEKWWKCALKTWFFMNKFVSEINILLFSTLNMNVKVEKHQ